MEVDLVDREFYHKQRVINFVHKWYRLCDKDLKTMPYVDPMSKLRMFSVSKVYDIGCRAFCTIGDNITNNKIPFKLRRQGVVKRFNIYKFFSKDYVPILEVIPFDFRKIKISKLIKKVTMSNHLSLGFPLPITSVSKIVGVFKGSVPFKVDSRTYFHDRFAEEEFLKDQFVDHDFFQHKEIIPGSWKYSNQNLIDMCTPKTAFYTPQELINGIFSRVGIDFKLPFVRYWSIEILNGILVKGSAFPGLITSKLFSSKRLLSTSLMKSFCKDYFYYIIKRYKYVLDCSLITVGGREKRVSYPSGFKKLKTRIVLMMEDIPTLICQSVAVPLTKAFQRLNSGYNFIGRSLEQRNYVQIEKELLRDPHTTIIFNADFSGHDNHVDEYQLVTAFSVLRLCFPQQWKYMDKLFFYCMSSMIGKNVVLPGSGFVYRIFKGIATGHPFTSLVNTTVAYMTFATAIHKVSTRTELEETRLFVAGDDVIGVIPLSILEKLSHEMTYNSGMKIDLISDHCGPLYSNDRTIQRSFLKKKFTILGIAWNDLELIDNLHTSTNGMKNSSSEITRMTDMLMNGPCDFVLNNRVLNIIHRHFETPRIRGLTYKDPPHVLHSMPPIKYSWKFFKRNPIRIYDKGYCEFIEKQFNMRLRLAFRWFNQGNPFPGLGFKDDSYWIDATKTFIPPMEYNFRYRVKYILRKRFGIRWEYNI